LVSQERITFLLHPAALVDILDAEELLPRLDQRGIRRLEVVIVVVAVVRRRAKGESRQRRADGERNQFPAFHQALPFRVDQSSWS